MDFVTRESGLLVPAEKIICKGKYEATLIRDGKIIDEWEADNITVNEGLNATLGIMLGGSAQITAWYLGLFTGNYTPVATDNAAGIAGNSTEATGYVGPTSGGTSIRQTFSPSSPGSQSINNSASRASYFFNASQTIYGAFLVSSATINGTSGTLFSAAQFGTAKPVVNLDQLLLTYTYNLATT